MPTATKLSVKLGRQTHRSRKVGYRRNLAACEPCRIAKTKCDGASPCCSCRRKLARTQPCVYLKSPNPPKIKTSRHREQVKDRAAISNARTSLDGGRSPSWMPVADGTDPAATWTPLQNTDTTCERLAVIHTLDHFFQLQSRRYPCLLTRVRKPALDKVARSVRTTVGQNSMTHQLSDLEDAVKFGQLADAFDIASKMLFSQPGVHGCSTSRSIARRMWPSQHGSPHSITSRNEALEQERSQLLRTYYLLAFFLGKELSLQTIGALSLIKASFLQEDITETDTDSQHLYEFIETLQGVPLCVSGRTNNLATILDTVTGGGCVLHIHTSALCITEDRAADKQEIRLFSNLILLMSHMEVARALRADLDQAGTGGARSHVRTQGHHARPQSLYAQVNMATKHAKLLLDAFDALFRINRVRTRQLWFCVYAALLASTLIGLNCCHNGPKQKVKRPLEQSKGSNMDDLARLQRLSDQLSTLVRLDGDYALLGEGLDILRNLMEDIRNIRRHGNSRGLKTPGKTSVLIRAAEGRRDELWRNEAFAEVPEYEGVNGSLHGGVDDAVADSRRHELSTGPTLHGIRPLFAGSYSQRLVPELPMNDGSTSMVCPVNCQPLSSQQLEHHTGPADTMFHNYTTHGAFSPSTDRPLARAVSGRPCQEVDYLDMSATMAGYTVYHPPIIQRPPRPLEVGLIEPMEQLYRAHPEYSILTNTENTGHTSTSVLESTCSSSVDMLQLEDAGESRWQLITPFDSWTTSHNLSTMSPVYSHYNNHGMFATQPCMGDTTFWRPPLVLSPHDERTPVQHIQRLDHPHTLAVPHREVRLPSYEYGHLCSQLRI